MTILTASANEQLDQLLEEICIALQLTDTQYTEAEKRYQAIGKWLSMPGSLLAPWKPEIYPQGSVRLQTTVKPRFQVEYDLDLVCLLHLDLELYRRPMTVYTMVEQRLKENDLYKQKIERYKRCLRICYANEFHLDITPACPDPSRQGTCILVPDRKVAQWKPSNPVGYAEWFDQQTLRRKYVLAEKRIEPLPANDPAHQKAPLRRMVQLLKRHRDVIFEGANNAPRSIALTTLAAHYYNGHELVTDGLMGVLDSIVAHIENTPGIIEIPNPANPPEKFCEAWANDPQAYKAFVDFIRGFQRRFRALFGCNGLENIASGLYDLFGEKVTKKAIAAYTERITHARERHHLRFETSKVGLTIGTSSMRAVPRNTFYGK